MKYIMCQNIHHWGTGEQYRFSIIDEDHNVISGDLTKYGYTHLDDLFNGAGDQSIFSVVR